MLQLAHTRPLKTLGDHSGERGGLLQCLENPATLIPTWQPQLTKEQSASFPTMHCRQEALGKAAKFMGVCLTGGLARQQTQQHH